MADELVAMVTGHRVLPVKDQVWIVHELERVALKLGASRMVSGMALGADTMWADLALRLERPLEAYVPFAGQELRWPEWHQSHYRELLTQADQVVTVCDQFSMEAYQLRNEAMVDRSGAVVAVWNSRCHGGTFNCLEYAMSQARSIVHIDYVRRVTTRRG